MVRIGLDETGEAIAQAIVHLCSALCLVSPVLLAVLNFEGFVREQTVSPGMGIGVGTLKSQVRNFPTFIIWSLFVPKITLLTTFNRFRKTVLVSIVWNST